VAPSSSGVGLGLQKPSTRLRPCDWASLYHFPILALVREVRLIGPLTCEVLSGIGYGGPQPTTLSARR
jgi:hypothetical protein